MLTAIKDFQTSGGRSAKTLGDPGKPTGADGQANCNSKIINASIFTGYNGMKLGEEVQAAPSLLHYGNGVTGGAGGYTAN